MRGRLINLSETNGSWDRQRSYRPQPQKVTDSRANETQSPRDMNYFSKIEQKLSAFSIITKYNFPKLLHVQKNKKFSTRIFFQKKKLQFNVEI